jgi:hypothetical protein
MDPTRRVTDRQARGWRSGVDPGFLQGILKRVVMVIAGKWRFDYSYMSKARCKCKRSFTQR